MAHQRDSWLLLGSSKYGFVQPFRIVVVGQEYGHNPIHVSLAHRRDMVLVETGLERRFVSEDGYARRNPHMVGTWSLPMAFH